MTTAITVGFIVTFYVVVYLAGYQHGRMSFVRGLKRELKMIDDECEIGGYVVAEPHCLGAVKNIVERYPEK